MVAPVLLQLDRGTGIQVKLEINLPRGLDPAPPVPMYRLRESFDHEAFGSPFQAAVIIGWELNPVELSRILNVKH